MNTSWRVGYWKLGLVSFVAMGYAIAFNRDCALAQITPDGTLGAESSVVTPTAPGSPVDVIDGGATRGANLFHSFEQFSVPPGGEASFNNAANIQNIISRVTGGAISNIDGLLRANGTANLFLLNPNGIIFGPNASLDIGGSFVGSTASSLNFADGTQFSATAPQTTPLLSVSVPIGLQYGGTAGGISSSGSVLRVSSGQSLLLLGGNVNLDDSFLYVDYSQGGRIELGGVSGPGTVGLNVDGNNLRLSFPNEVARADVSLSNGARLDVSAEDGGSIAINARNLDVSGGSTLTAGIASGYGAVDSQAGDITLNATGAVAVTDSSTIFNKVNPGAVGNAGGIDITAGSLEVTKGAFLNASTDGQGNAGSVTIKARDQVSLDGVLTFSIVGPEAVGQGGDINITAGSLEVKNGAQLQALTNGQGNAGSVNINAPNMVTFDQGSAFSTVEKSGRMGNAGGINITAGSLEVKNGSQLQSLTRGQGDAGNVNINALNMVTFDGDSAAYSSVGPGVVGKGGDINITAGSLEVKNGAFLNASTDGQGDAGSVTINARDQVSFDGVLTFSIVGPEAVGQGGDINITAGSLEVKNGAQLQTLTNGQGDAGSVNINALNMVTFDGDSAAYSIVGPEAVGQGGDINITAGSLEVKNGAFLNASTDGQGDAGSVTINARDQVSFDGVLTFSIVGPEAVGQGGDINITAGSLEVRNGAFLNASTDGQGDAGDMNIIARDTVSFYGISSNGRPSIAETSVGDGSVGNGGDINIRTRSLDLTDSAYLTTQTNGSGNAGTININAEQLSLSSDASLRGDVSATGRGQGGDINLDVTGKILLTGGIPAPTGESTRITIGVLPEGIGSGGDLKIKAGSLVLTDGAIIKNSTQGQGSAGNIQVNADVVDISGSVPDTGLPSGLFTSTDTTGSAGDIFVATRTFRVADGAALSARSRGDGPGGDISVNATSSFEAVNGGQFVTTTFGQGRAGNIFVNATDRVTVSGSDPNYANRIAKFPRSISRLVANAIKETGAASGLFANTETGSTGQGGGISITTGQLLIRDGAQVSAETAGTGSGGTLEVSAPESVTLSGMGSLSAQATADGNAGNLTINTSQLMVQDGAEVSTSTTSGVGGDITLGGLNSLQVSNGGEISASTATGQAGSLSVNANENAADSVQLSGQDSRLSAQANGRGNAGSLTINARKLTVQDGAEATVSSREGQAGNLTVTADSIRLDEGKLTAVTGAGNDSGNITLQGLDLLLMRDHSLISAEALGAANGGNIDIDTDFLVAVPSEDSNIIANAMRGNGGKVDITASGIFGIQSREQQTSESDITASSTQGGINGEVAINNPDVDPTQGLVELPAELVDASNQIATGCPDAVWRGESKFIITGRGGLPPSPTEPLRGDNTLTNWSTLDSDVENRSSAEEGATNSTIESAPTQIVEANGWVIGDNGEVTLVATAPTATLDIPWLPSTDCNAPEPSS